MRVRDRCLLFSVFVFAVVIVLASRGGKQITGLGVAITFLGYTNFPGGKVCSAVFVVTNEHPTYISVEAPRVEFVGQEDYEAHRLNTQIGNHSNWLIGEGNPWLFDVDRPACISTQDML